MSQTVQAEFDLDIEPTLTGFDTMQTPESGGKCSQCLRALKGRYARCHGASREGVWFAWCDDCTVANWRVA